MKNKPIWRIQKGFTLVEALIYMALMSVLLVVMTEIFVSILDVRTETQTKTSTEAEGRFILQRLAYDISRASSLVTPSTLGNSGSTLTLQINGQNYTYSNQNGNLQLAAPDGTANLNSSATTISAVSFKRTGNTGGKALVTFSLTLTSTSQLNGNADTKVFSSTVGIR